MPLLPGKKNVSHNIREMVRAGHAQKQAVAASLNKAGEKKKKKPSVTYAGPPGIGGGVKVPTKEMTFLNPSISQPRHQTGQPAAAAGSLIPNKGGPHFVTEHLLGSHYRTGQGATVSMSHDRMIPEGHEFIDFTGRDNPDMHRAFESIPPNWEDHHAGVGSAETRNPMAGHLLPEGLIDDKTFHPHWKQIAAEPHDYFHKLVLADRLEEHGHTDFANHLREHFDPSSPKSVANLPMTMQEAIESICYSCGLSEKPPLSEVMEILTYQCGL